MKTGFRLQSRVGEQFPRRKDTSYANRSSNVGLTVDFAGNVGRSYFFFCVFGGGAVDATGENGFRFGRRQGKRDGPCVSRHPLRGGLGGKFAVEAADARGEVGRGAQGY